MKRTVFACGLLVTLSLLAEGQVSPQVVPQMTYYLVAKPGPQPSDFNYFWGVAVARVGSDDHVSFLAGLVNGTMGIWTDNVTGTAPPQLSLIASVGSTVSGACGNIAAIDAFPHPHINSSGQTAFSGKFSGVNCSSNHRFIMRHTLGGNPALVLMAQYGDAAPGRGTFTDLDRAFGLGSGLYAGEVAFLGAATPAPPAGTTGIWSTSGGAIVKIAREGDTAPGTNNKTFSFFGGASLEPQYNAILQSGFRARATSPTVTGVWTGIPGQTQTFVTDTTQIAPGTTSLLFVDFQAVAINANGVVAFRGCLPTSCASNSGIWKGAQFNQLTLVTRTGQPAPDQDGLPAGTFQAFNNPGINAAGDTAFRATLQGSADDGIWAENIHAPGLRRIVKKGDALRGTSLTFDSFDPDLVINDGRQLAFTATLSDGSRGLFFVTPQIRTVFKIVRSTEFFDVGFDPAVQILYVDFFPGSIAQGVSGFNNAGTLAYRLSFVGGGPPEQRAIVLTTIDT